MRAALALIPMLALAGGLRAEEATADDLVARLAHDDFNVREQATKDLIAMGEKAIPALEKALKSEDLEVRLRSGRALRAIQNGKEPAKPEGSPKEGDGRPAAMPGSVRSVQVEVGDGHAKVTVRSVENGAEKVTTYEGATLEEIQEKHPELKEALGGTRFHFGRGDSRDWPGFFGGGGIDRNDEFWRNWEEEMQRTLEEMRKWQRQWRTERFGRDPFEGQRPEARPTRARFGVTVEPVDDVLDAQLDLGGKGLVIRNVEKGSAAEGLGLRPFDILMEMNGAPVSNREDLLRALDGRKEGESLSATVLRKSQRVTLPQ